jgi:hypothetical protein
MSTSATRCIYYLCKQADRGGSTGWGGRGGGEGGRCCSASSRHTDIRCESAARTGCTLSVNLAFNRFASEKGVLPGEIPSSGYLQVPV